MARRKRWSFNVGERGKNWLRAYEDDRDGKLYVDWREPVLHPDSEDSVVDTKTGRPLVTRRRLSLAKFGITSRTEAKQKATAMAERFAEMDSPAVSQLTLERLLNLYVKQVTPTKGESKQSHDRRAVRTFRAFFERRGDARRRMDRPAGSLAAADWNEFVHERRAGLIRGWGPVKDRQIAYDLKFLVAVLGWAEGADENANHHMERNPRGIIRKKQKPRPLARVAGATVYISGPGTSRTCDLTLIRRVQQGFRLLIITDELRPCPPEGFDNLTGAA